MKTGSDLSRLTDSPVNLSAFDDRSLIGEFDDISDQIMI
jgi:hypothetical protein